MDPLVVTVSHSLSKSFGAFSLRLVGLFKCSLS